MSLQSSICLAAGVGISSIMASCAMADDGVSGAKEAAVVDRHAVARAFRDLAEDQLGAEPCLFSLRALDGVSGEFGKALVGHAFACDGEARMADAPEERLAKSFAAVAGAPGGGDGDARTPFARTFERFGLPEPVDALDVAGPTVEAPASPVDPETDARIALTEITKPADDAANVIPEAASEQELAPAPRVAVAADAAKPAEPEIARTVSSAPLAAAVAAAEAPAVADVATHVIAEEPQGRTGSRPPVSPRPERRRTESREDRAESRAAAARREARRAQIAEIVEARRRAARASRARIQSARSIAVRQRRVESRQGPAVAAPETAVEARPHARSFSPKMSSAGPAQPTRRQ